MRVLNNIGFKILSLGFLSFTPFFMKAHPYPFSPCSTSCQTFSGSVCPLKSYDPQFFTSCLANNYFYFCVNSYPYSLPYQNSCLLKSNPCVCLHIQTDIWSGIPYYIYENGLTF